MGWPRRRRQQQQQLRRRAAKDYLLACCSAAIDICGAVMTTTMPTKAPTHQYYPADKRNDLPAKPAAATWRHTASPLKPKQKQLVSSGRRHRGLREKLYSVDSLAETEPEDNDDLDDDETASESGDLSPLYHHHLGHHHSSASKLKIEPVIPEETPVGTKSLFHADSEDLVETDDEDEGSYASKVSPAASESSAEALEEEEEESETSEPTASTSELLVLESKPKTTTTIATSAIVDGDETESENEATALETVISNCSVTVEEVASTSVDLFGQELASPSASQTSESSETSEPSESATKHAPFLFPAPYFPGDVDEYESDIYEMLLRREKVHHVESDYFGFQPHVTIVMRSMLLDWLVEVHNHFNLQPETLYLTVNYIDRFLATVPIKRENFQLVALTALLVRHILSQRHMCL